MQWGVHEAKTRKPVGQGLVCGSASKILFLNLQAEYTKVH